jgi:hypothetical protein
VRAAAASPAVPVALTLRTGGLGPTTNSCPRSDCAASGERELVARLPTKDPAAAPRHSGHHVGARLAAPQQGTWPVGF